MSRSGVGADDIADLAGESAAAAADSPAADDAAPLVRDRTTARLDLDSIVAEHSARGAFVRHAQAAIAAASDGQQAEVLREAMRYGLAALAGLEVGLR